MNNKKLLIASSSRSEAISQWVINNQLINETVELVFVEELLSKYTIQDTLADEEVCVQWFENDLLKYTNHTHCLLNRVIHIDKSLFNHFKYQDREYAAREFESYLGFAFNAFEKVQNIAINGICERVYSLPQQWHLAEKFGLSVPAFYWGNKQNCPLSNGLETVHSNIYNFLNWSSADNDECATGFCFEKPDGDPLFILSIGSSWLITSELKLTNKQLDSLEQFLAQIKNIFNYFLFELLLFVSKDKFIFGCVNIDVNRSRRNPLFGTFLHNNLLQEFDKCLN